MPVTIQYLKSTGQICGIVDHGNLPAPRSSDNPNMDLREVNANNKDAKALLGKFYDPAQKKFYNDAGKTQEQVTTVTVKP